MTQFVRHIETYGHGGRIGVLLELRLEYESTANTDRFRQLARDVAMHIAARQPVSLEELMQQGFAKDSTGDIGQLLSDAADELRDQISIERFIRWDTELPAAAPSDPPRTPANVVRFPGRGEA